MNKKTKSIKRIKDSSSVGSSLFLMNDEGRATGMKKNGSSLEWNVVAQQERQLITHNKSTPLQRRNQQRNQIKI